MKINSQLKSVFKLILPLIIFIILVQTILVYFFLYQVLITQARNNLDKTTNRIKEDIIFNQGKWDLTQYNADSDIQDNNPLYIITSEGVVVERSRPINGLLDLSRFTLINQYLFPTTVESVSNENWRVLAEPIYSGEQAIGIIFASFYQPDEKELPQIDLNLQSVIDTIHQKLTVSGDSINVSKVDSRWIPYNINFQIVTRFNKVIHQSNNNNSVTRMPTNIDRSYVDNQLKGGQYRQVTDSVTKKKYLTSTISVLNDKNLLAGVIVTGIPIDETYRMLDMFVLFNLLSAGGLALVLTSVCIRIFRIINIKYQNNAIQKPAPKSIRFLKKECKLMIDEKSIEIPYASFQYYFCSALTQKPQKKWETDEILEVFGEDMGSDKWRKVYDTMVGLNRKTEHLVEKLFVVRDKRYFINPSLNKIVEIVTT